MEINQWGFLGRLLELCLNSAKRSPAAQLQQYLSF